MTLPTNLPALLRAEGLRVVEHDGWRTRGRPGSFSPVGVLCHHTATSKSASDEVVCRLLIAGRSDLPGPLCQIGLARDGTVHLIAAGRANHAGVAKSSGTVAAGDGNTLYIGIEAFNDGVGEPWPAEQYDAYVTLAAALCKHVTGNSAQTVRAHKETSVTGKIDPRFDMDAFRARVHALISEPPTPATRRPPARSNEGDDMALDDKALEQIAHAVWAKDLGGGDNRKPARLHLIQAANASLRNEDLRGHVAELRKAVAGNASRADIEAMLSNLDATIQLIVKEES